MYWLRRMNVENPEFYVLGNPFMSTINVDVDSDIGFSFFPSLHHLFVVSSTEEDGCVISCAEIDRSSLFERNRSILEKYE